MYCYHMSGLYLKIKNIFGLCPRFSLASVATNNIKMIVKFLCIYASDRHFTVNDLTQWMNLNGIT